jgi:hypothetical protein
MGFEDETYGRRIKMRFPAGGWESAVVVPGRMKT